MKGIQSLLILFLLPGLPLFQIDQAVEVTCFACENSLFLKSEIESPLADQNLSFNLDPPFSSFDQLSLFFQLKNPIAVLVSYFQGPSPFWRPPPAARTYSI